MSGWELVFVAVLALLPQLIFFWRMRAQSVQLDESRLDRNVALLKKEEVQRVLLDELIAIRGRLDKLEVYVSRVGGGLVK
jgi:hypothetical protein